MALRERIAAAGGALLPPLEFIDEGYSGGTFVRPGPERRRDAAPQAITVEQVEALLPWKIQPRRLSCE